MPNKKNNFLRNTLIFLFVIYVALYIAVKTGFYKNTIRKDALYTQKQIEQFENDLANNTVVDINSYLPEEVDYSNFLTKSANAVSNHLANVINEKKDNVWDFLKSLFIG